MHGENAAKDITALFKRDTGKQCRPRSDAADRGVWSGSTQFALNTDHLLIMIITNQTSLLLKKGPVQSVEVAESTRFERVKE